MITPERYNSVTDSAFPYIKKHNGVVYSKPKLEYLYDIGDCILVSQMLSSNLGSRLETLNLDIREYESSQYIIPRLKDLPVLKRLYIGTTSVSVLDLEHVHSTISSIQNFALIRVSILAFSMPSDIILATFITNLNFEDLRYADKETCAKMYQYITRKYTSLSHIKYNDKVWHDDEFREFNASQQRYIYLNGFLNFLKMAGSKQRKLVLNGLPGDVDIFQALDDVDAKLEYLSLIKCESATTFQYLAQSKQSEYIQELFIINTEIDSILPLEGMTALTKLYIGCIRNYSRHIHLVDCLAGCPSTLKSITI
jgi:hypothetical protein